MTLKARIASLEGTISNLRAQLKQSAPLDAGGCISVHSAVAAVAANLSALDDEKRERVLYAVAVLYGIIKPGGPVLDKGGAGEP